MGRGSSHKSKRKVYATTENLDDDSATSAKRGSTSPTKMAQSYDFRQATPPVASQGRPKGISSHTRPVSQVCSKCRDSRDMPAMHFAAYNGHYSCLEAFLTSLHDNNNSLAITILDKTKRTPLFYAVAANRVDCVTLLLLHRPDWMDVTDSQSDTTVHVACFFGWGDVLHRLLSSGANPHVRNAKGFKPSHIAKNPACLELLLSYGDDLVQGDNAGRSPLFVACARNRKSCVEFLCSHDYQTNSWMLEQADNRGDLPSHAAACNGATDALKILISYGVNLHATNGKNLTPLMLASANSHSETVQVLTEAQASQDSGSTWYTNNKTISDNTNNTAEDEAQSYNHEAWTACYESNSGNTYYYHKQTGRCQWEVPTAADENNNNNSEEGDEFVWVKKRKESVSTKPQGLDAKSSWIAIQDPSTQAMYYRNTKTGEAQWEEPDALEKIQKEATAHASLHASELWDELNNARETLASSLEAERARQLALFEKRIFDRKTLLVAEHKDYKFKRAVMKVSLFTMPKAEKSFVKIASMRNVLTPDASELESLYKSNPTLEIFLSTHYYDGETTTTSAGEVTVSKKIIASLFHYFKPQCSSMTKVEFRSCLKECRLIPSSPTDKEFPPLKLHVADLIYVQANKEERKMNAQRFYNAMQLVAERVGMMMMMTDDDDDDDKTPEEMERAMVDKYLMPLVTKLSNKMASFIRECKRQSDLFCNSSDVKVLLELNRIQLQGLYKFYASSTTEVKECKLMTFKGMVQFATDFNIIPTMCDERALYSIFEAVNWINGNTHMLVLSYEKFIQIIGLLPQRFLTNTNSSIDTMFKSFLESLDATDGKHKISQAPKHATFIRVFKLAPAIKLKKTMSQVTEEQV